MTVLLGAHKSVTEHRAQFSEQSVNQKSVLLGLKTLKWQYLLNISILLYI